METIHASQEKFVQFRNGEAGREERDLVTQVSATEAFPPLHWYPHSTVHVLEHPATPDPASHCSLPTTLPSPQTWLHVVRPQRVLLQIQPGSNAQVDEQPSPFTLFPSSQGSGPALIPSPQLCACVCVRFLDVTLYPE
jgi:hypothetical protein